MKRKIVCAVLALVLGLAVVPAAGSGFEAFFPGTAVFAEDETPIDDSFVDDAAEPGEGEEPDGQTDPADPSEKPDEGGEEEPIIITSFNDVNDPAKYYYTPVYWAVGKNITNGTDAKAGLFSPDLGCTRGQIVTFLWRAAGSPEPETAANPFTDITPEDYFCKAVLWAVENGITNGTTDSTFDPKATCTRAQSVTLIWRYCGSKGSGADAFSDVKSSAYYYKAVFWAVQNGVTNGTGPKQFSPDATCTRGQIVSFLYHALLDTTATKEKAGASGTFSVTDIDGQKATFNVNASALKADAEIKEVRATVASGTGDLRWVTLTAAGSGKYTKAVDAKEFSGFAKYTVKFYIVTDAEQLILMDTKTADVKKVNYATVQDIGNRQFRITIEGVDTAVTSITSCVWSEKNGNDDVKWLSMSKKNAATWEVTVNCLDFKDSGVFLADLYSNDSKLLATLRFDVPASYLVLTVQEQVDKETEKVYASVGRDLKACFNYSAGIRYYRSTPEPKSGYTNSQWYALYGFQNHKGHCYVHAATFYWLAKNLGYDVKYIQGYVPRKGGGLITHGWVEIKINGTTYVCDPNFTNETGRNGYMIRYGTSGTWRYQSYRQYS